MTKKLLMLFAGMFLFLSGCQDASDGTPAPALPAESQNTETAEPAAQEKEKDKETIVILHTNDVHCGLDNRIGYDGLYLYKEEMKQEYENVLLVDAGDAIQGGIYGTLSNGKIIIDLMNDVGYDCATIGNHEFDYGFEVLDDPRFRSEMVMSKLHGIDLLIDAHEHAKDAYEQKDKEGRMVPYTQAGTKLATIGKVLIHPDNTITSEFADEVPEPEGIDAKPVARGKKEYWVDTAINRKIAEYTSDYDDLLKRKIGEIGFDLPVRSEEEGSLAKRHETGLMNLFADALCVLSESDISMHNGGGIREGLTKGDILYSDCVNAFPYGNDILVMKMKGQLILDVLEFSAKKLPMGNNGLIHGMGLEYTVDLSVPTSVKEDANGTFISIDGPYRVKDVRILGEPLDPNKEYTAAMSAYLQEGGDGFSMMKDAELLQYTQKVESGIFAEYIEKTLGGVVPEKYNAL